MVITKTGISTVLSDMGADLQSLNGAVPNLAVIA
jgi:hypothetical protein